MKAELHLYANTGHGFGIRPERVGPVASGVDDATRVVSQTGRYDQTGIELMRKQVCSRQLGEHCIHKARVSWAGSDHCRRIAIGESLCTNSLPVPRLLSWHSPALALAQNQQPPGGNNPSTRAGAGAAAGNPQTAPARRGGGRGRGNQDPDMVFTRPTDSPGLGTAMDLPKPDADGFSAMFNGTDLSGWDALPKFWSVKDGALDCVETGEPGGNIQSDLIWIDSREHPEKYANFELHLKFKFLSHSGNSGVQFRSVVDKADTKHIGGYQADMDPGNQYTGGIYDESSKAGRRQKDVQHLLMAPRVFRCTTPRMAVSARELRWRRTLRH